MFSRRHFCFVNYLASAVIVVCGASVTVDIAHAAESATQSSAVKITSNVAYKSGDSLTDYEKERCKLDIYQPAQQAEGQKLPVLVWFYGGGLEGGSKDGAKSMASAWVTQKMIVVAPNYRLSPRSKYPSYLDDAAASVAWVFKNIDQYGGDTKNIFITGHSAGGYLCAQIAFEPKYLAAYGVKTEDLAGTLPISGQMFTHFTIRKERGVPNARYTPVIDTDAPVYHVRGGIPPTLLLVADNDMPMRVEETQYFMALATALKIPDVKLVMIKDRDHGSIMGKMIDVNDPGFVAMCEFMRTHHRP